MSSVLKINGSTVNRSTAKVVLQRLTLSMDGAETLEFSELVHAADSGTYSGGDTVELDVDGSTVFVGFMARPTPTKIGDGMISVSYLAMGFRWLANQIFITASDGTGAMQWNLPVTDPYYLPSNSGKSVGEILTNVLQQHATQLTAVGIGQFTGSTLPTATLTDLSLLTVVPPEAVTITGRLWDACVDFLVQWMPKYAMWIDGSGLIKIKDTTGFAATTYTLDSDVVTLDHITKDHSECYTQVIVRGSADIQPAYLSLAEGTLGWAQTHTDETNWTIDDFLSPQGASEVGAITGMTSTTLNVTVDLAGSQPSHAAHYWSTVEAYVWAYNPLATNLAFIEYRQITDNTADGGSGTSYTITVGTPFNNSGYTRYAVRASQTELSLTWRKLLILPVDGSGNNYVAQHLTRLFNHSVPWSPTDGVVVQTQTPVANVCWSSSGTPPYTEFPCPIEVVLYDGTTNGYLVLYQPAPVFYASQTQLHTPGASPGPGDVKVCVPYSRGALSAQAPTSGYQGTAYTVDGIQRTLYLDYPQWLDRGNLTAMATLAQQKLDSVKDTVYEGSLTIWDKDSTWLTLGRSVNIARAGGTTGWEAINAPVRSVTLEWPQSGAAIWTTRLNFTTRRRPFTGDRLYLHPLYGTQQLMMPSFGEGYSAMGRAAMLRSGMGGDQSAIAAGAMGFNGGMSPGSVGAPVYGSDVGATNRMTDAQYNAGIDALNGDTPSPRVTKQEQMRREQHQRRLAREEENRKRQIDIQGDKEMQAAVSDEPGAAGGLINVPPEGQ